MELVASFQHHYESGARIHGDFTLPLERPALTVLFGPSGCGKTTLLRSLAGLERPHQGRLTAGNEVWVDAEEKRFIPAHLRQVGFLPQKPALFPHLTVAANVGFGLKGEAGRSARIQELLELVGLGDLSHRRPHQLSGGQQQRVALARALAPRPRLLLLDEPFAALDREAQVELRQRLRDNLRASLTPALLVTHLREEALALGDHLLLMDQGRIIQSGLPEDIFSHPAATGLAEEGPVLKVRTLDRAHGLVRVAAGHTELWAPDPGGLGIYAFAAIRPEGITIEHEPSSQASARNRLAAQILSLEAEGPLVRLRLDAGFPLDALVTAWACQDLRLQPGDSVTALIKATAITLSPAPESRA